MIIASIVFAVLFVLWIWKGKNPFLGRSFVTNGAYMSILLLQFVLYFFNFACVPIYNVIGEQIYNVPLTTVSLCLTLVYIVATIVGCVSGPVINRLGRMRTLVIAIVLMIVGFAGSAIFIVSKCIKAMAAVWAGLRPRITVSSTRMSPMTRKLGP